MKMQVMVNSWQKLPLISSCCGLLLLSACVGVGAQDNSIRYYSLETRPSNVVNTANQVTLKNAANPEAQIIGVKQVSLPSIFNSQSIVYRISEHELVQTERHKWAGGLKDQLNLSLVSELKNQGMYGIMGGCDLAEQSSCGELWVSIVDFSGSFKGQASVAFDWTYKYQDKICHGQSNSTEVMKDDGYENLVVALNSAWKKSLSEMILGFKSCQ